MVAVKLFTCEFGETTKPNKKYIFSIFIFNTLYQLLTFKPLQVVFPHIPTCCFEVWKWSEAGNFESFFHLICPEWRSKERITEKCALRGNRGLTHVKNALQKAQAYALDFLFFPPCYRGLEVPRIEQGRFDA